ncbi:hypothetical protein DSO57_1003935 [Entomophthora muscae]|uniref:Uncharacterized protein n=1 Tax=Entomophthora muscae TaxID=34485 RepID=A0ACC2RZG3_9FUNG|nr:hypothetical protein DSO57_1003935 [Entomophthora muscae]
MKPFLYQILLLLTLACLVPVLCENNLGSTLKENADELTKGIGEVGHKLVTAINELSNGMRITLGVGSIVVGLLFLIVGKFLIRVVFALSGGCLLGGLVFYFGRAIEKSQSPSALLIAVIVVAAVIGMMLGYFMLKVGAVLLGGLAGVSLTLLFAHMNYVTETVNKIIGVILVLAFCLLAFFLSDIIVVAFTGIVGSFVFMVGVDFFARKGFNDFLFRLDFGDLKPPNTDVKIMVGATLFIAILGFLFQLCVFRKKSNNKLN